MWNCIQVKAANEHEWWKVKYFSEKGLGTLNEQIITMTNVSEIADDMWWQHVMRINTFCLYILSNVPHGSIDV